MNENINLVEDPWIPVMLRDGTRKLYSLRSVFKEAHNIESINSELETMNFALLRFLLAILYRVIQPIEGEAITEPEEALALWEDWWKPGQFENQTIGAYLEKVKDRFNLFDDKYPVFQVGQRTYTPTKGKKGEPKFKIRKLYGDLSESNNKMRLFQNHGVNKDVMASQDIPRWLLHLMYFDDAAAKLTTGVGWVGQCYPVYAKGSNLFETLMLNLVLLDTHRSNYDYKPYPAGIPSWEKEERDQTPKKREIDPPESPVELLTYWGRKIVLVSDRENSVIGFDLIGGDYFEPTDFAIENYTSFRYENPKKPSAIVPDNIARKDPSVSRQFWRELQSVFLPEKETILLPGVVKWIRLLIEEEHLPFNQLYTFQTCSVQYGASNATIAEISDDSITFPKELVLKMDEPRKEHFLKELAKAAKVANIYSFLSRDLAALSGNTSESVLKAHQDTAKQEAYAQLDPLVRDFLRDFELSRKNPYKEWNQDLFRMGESLMSGLERRVSPKVYYPNKYLLEKGKESDTGSYYKARYKYLNSLSSITGIDYRPLKKEENAA